MLTRLMLLGTISFAIVLLGKGPPPVPAARVSAQVVQRTEFRHPPPSCDEILNSQQWKDKFVNCIESPPPTYDPPRARLGRFGGVS